MSDVKRVRSLTAALDPKQKSNVLNKLLIFDDNNQRSDIRDFPSS